MDEIISLAINQTFNVQFNLFNFVKDPSPIVCGAIAGGVGRALTLPLDMGGKKGIAQTVARRVPQYALLFGMYVPCTAALNKKVENPEKKLITVCMAGALAGFYMRAWTNPINRVFDEAQRMGTTPGGAVKALKNKTVLQFWYTGHPLIGNAIYFGALFSCFEGTRRFMERNGAPTGTPINNAITNGAAGAVGAMVASTVTYPISAHTYRSTVIYNSAVCRGLLPTLAKEVPLSFFVFGTYSLLQSAISTSHAARGGFGYSKH